jgi:uncharacterized integral membrane protein
LQGGESSPLSLGLFFAHSAKNPNKKDIRRLKMAYVKSIIFIIVLLVLITFGVKNNQPTLLNYYFNITTGTIPLYSIVYISIIIGIIIGMIVGVSSRISLRKKVKQVQRENRELKEKIEKAEEERKEEEKEENTERED